MCFSATASFSSAAVLAGLGVLTVRRDDDRVRLLLALPVAGLHGVKSRPEGDEHWLVSVWCYFAALLSAIVLLHFKTLPRSVQGLRGT